MVNESTSVIFQKAIIFSIFTLIVVILCVVGYFLLKKLAYLFDKQFNENEVIKKRPKCITAIAMLSFLGIFSVQHLFSSSKLLLFGIIFSGTLLKIYAAISAILSLYIAIGLLKLWRPSWHVALSFNIIYLINHTLNVFADSTTVLQLMSPNSLLDSNKYTATFFSTNILLLLVELLFIGFIYSSKTVFQKQGDGPKRPPHKIK